MSKDIPPTNQYLLRLPATESGINPADMTNDYLLDAVAIDLEILFTGIYPINEAEARQYASKAVVMRSVLRQLFNLEEVESRENNIMKDLVDSKELLARNERLKEFIIRLVPRLQQYPSRIVEG